jgi:hypothetical protein
MIPILSTPTEVSSCNLRACQDFNNPFVNYFEEVILEEKDYPNCRLDGGKAREARVSK